MTGNSVQWSRVIADRLNSSSTFAQEHRAWLQNSTFEDAEKKFHEVESQTQSKKSTKAIQKLRPLLDTFNRFADLAATLASLEPHGIASLVVGSLKVTLQLASAGIKDFEEISSFFDEIHNSFGILMINEERLNKRPWNADRLNNAVYEVFNAYWAFFEDVYSLLYSSERHKVRGFWSHAKDYLTFKIEKVKSHLGIIRDYCEAAKEEADLAWKLNQDDVNSLLQQSIGNIEKQMTEQQRVLYRQDRLRFKSWLTPVEVDDRMSFILRVRTPDTGNWIFNDAHFQAWAFGDRQGKTNKKPLLWLSAGPGFGKSVLTAFITSDLRRSSPTGIAYFPCSSNEADRRSIPAMLRTLIHQLFRDDVMTGEPHYTVTPANINSQQGLPQPNMTALVDLFKYKSWEEPSKTTVLIIDALDECPKTEESEVQMGQLFTLFAELPPSWKIMFTSRRAPWFEESLESLPQGKLERLVMTKRDNEQDIYAYTLHQLDEMAKSSNYKWQYEFRREMEESITLKSEGMFKWTYLALKTLGGSRTYQSDMAEARKALEKVPPDLKGIYEKSLRGLSEVEDSTTRDDLTRALRWILRAYRPLKVKELGIGLAQAFDEIEQIDDLREKLERHLGDLIYIDAGSDTVGLTHTSARDFLVTSQDIKDPGGDSMIPNQLGEIDREILQACLTYLDDRQFLDAQPGDSKTQKAFNDALMADGFWEYACIGILQHLGEVCRANQLDEEVEGLLDVFFRSDNNQVFLRWLQMFCYLRFTNRNGAVEAYSTLLDALFDMDSGATKPLASLLKQKFRDVVDHIGYSAGGRFIRWQRFFTHANSPCFSPTLLASFFNFRPALELLAKGNEMLHYKNHGARCDALYWSTCGDSPDALALMLSDEYIHRFPEFKLPTDNRFGLGRASVMFEGVWLPMEIKARPGTYPAAIMLLDHGARISWGFETIVFEQLPDTAGTKELTEKMLRINRAFTFSDDAVGRALHFAAFTGQSHILSAFWQNKDLLRNLVQATFRKEDVDDVLKNDFSIRRQLAFARWRGMGPMHHAAANNDAQSVRLLCHNMARLDDMQCDFNDWTVMHLAAIRGLQRLRHSRDRHNDWTVTRQPIDPSAHVVEILDKMPADADWTVLDRVGNLPIHLAAYCGCEVTVRLLSGGQTKSKQYNWDKPNYAGKTPLAIALELKYLPVAEALLHNGASLDKVPEHIRNQFNFRNKDSPKQMIIEQKRPFWLELTCIIRARAKQLIPLPIIARILDFSNNYETLTVERRDHYIHTELVRDLIYLRSPPILTSSNSAPVRRIALTAHSYRQNYTDHDFAKTWSWLRTDKLAPSIIRPSPWHEKPIWRWNYRKPTEETVVYSYSKPKDAPYLRALVPGDRISITPVPTYPAWEANIEWARISIDMALIRNVFSNQDRQRIWRPRKAVGSVKARQVFEGLVNGKVRLGIVGHRDADDGLAEGQKLPRRRKR